MKTIIIHHLETMWTWGLKKAGTSFEEVSHNVLLHLLDNEYDRVILTRFEDNRLEDAHYEAGLGEFIDIVEDYAYGWEEGSIDGQLGTDWTEGGSHSEIVLLTEWMHELKTLGSAVDLCGAFDGECIEDMEIALSSLGIDFNRLNHLIV